MMSFWLLWITRTNLSKKQIKAISSIQEEIAFFLSIVSKLVEQKLAFNCIVFYFIQKK
jgi:hypothetical protein